MGAGGVDFAIGDAVIFGHRGGSAPAGLRQIVVYGETGAVKIFDFTAFVGSARDHPAEVMTGGAVDGLDRGGDDA